MSKGKNQNGIDLGAYRDPSGVSEGEMDFGLWLSEHRGQMVRLIIILLIAICAFFFVYSSYNYIVYFITGSDPAASLTGANSVLAPRKLYSDMEIAAPKVLPSGSHYDLAAQLTNPNSKFLANFSFCFSQEGKDIACGRSFILPDESKMVYALGQNLANGSGLSFRITEIFWQRVDAHRIPDWKSFSAERLNFYISDLNLAEAASDGTNSLDFSVQNRTVFGYYEVPLIIYFYRGSEVVGMNRYVVKDFLAGETRPVRLSWSGGLSGITRTEVRPELNIIDDSIYRRYQGENVK